MKTDAYTKIVLTIIALCLLVLVFKGVDLAPEAYASGANNNTPLNNKTNYGLVPINEDGTINVRLNTNQVVDVRLRGIDEAPNLRWEVDISEGPCQRFRSNRATLKDHTII